MTLDKEIKQIEKAEASLAKKKKELVEQAKKEKAAQAKLEALFKQSGFATPKDLVEALIAKYQLRFPRKRTNVSSTGRRKRTKITPELRDTVKAKLKKSSMNSVSKEMEISYAVIAKIAKGAYDGKK